MAAFHRMVSPPALGGLVEPETVLGWHRELGCRKWATFGRRRGVGRPRLEPNLRELIWPDGPRESELGMRAHTRRAAEGRAPGIGHRDPQPASAGEAGSSAKASEANPQAARAIKHGFPAVPVQGVSSDGWERDS